MKKKNMWIAAALMMAAASMMPCKAQQVTALPLSMDDVAFALEMLGVQTTRFDLTPFKNEKYNVSIYIDEYEKGNPERIKRNYANFGENLLDIRNYQEEEWDEARKLYDIPQDEYIGVRIKDVVFAIYHAKGDSVATLKFNVNFAGGSTRPLKLHELEGEKDSYSYHSRPFALKPVTDSDYAEIPLWLYGSAWKDQNFFRFCGENEIDPNLKETNSTLLTHCPHYYIIGVALEKVKK